MRTENNSTKCMLLATLKLEIELYFVLQIYLPNIRYEAIQKYCLKISDFFTLPPPLSPLLAFLLVYFVRKMAALFVSIINMTLHPLYLYHLLKHFNFI